MLRHRRSKSAEERPEEPANAPRVGADLTTARERTGLSIEEMAAQLRIRPEYLEALEQGRIGVLPATAYAVAFLRAYGRALGLDADELVRRFKNEAASVVSRRPKLAFPAPVPRRGVPASAMMMLGLALTVGAYAAWYKLAPSRPAQVQTVEPVPARLASLVSPPPPPPAATPAPAPAVVGQTAPPAAPVPSAASVPATPDQTADLSPGSAAAATPPAPTPPPDRAGDASSTGLALHASADAWVQVRVRNGPVLFSRILHSGETWAIPARTDLLMTTGNAGGTELIKDGVVSSPLGGPGVVRRDLPLDPDSVDALAQAPAR